MQLLRLALFPLFLFPLASAAAAQEFLCQDAAAEEIGAYDVDSASVQSCGIGLVLFGEDFSVSGDRCPDRKFLHPAHSTCTLRLEGSRCVFVETREVRIEKCDCRRWTFFGFGLSTTDCECEDSGATAGSVDHFRTAACREDEVEA